MENKTFEESTKEFAGDLQALLNKYKFTLRGNIGYSSAGVVVVQGDQRMEIMELVEDGYNIYGIDHPNKRESFY